MAEGLVLDLQRGRDAEEQEWSQKEAEVIIAHRDGQIADIPVQLGVAIEGKVLLDDQSYRRFKARSATVSIESGQP